jgi:hypothetical protein
MAIRAGTEVPVEARGWGACQSRIREFVEGRCNPREVAWPSLLANKKPRHPARFTRFPDDFQKSEHWTPAMHRMGAGLSVVWRERGRRCRLATHE